MKLELRGITKRFGAVVANDHMDLIVEPGEIVCLLGENGAGKSTLVNVLCGLLKADEGDVLLDGVRAEFTTPGQSIAAGIGMVHQHFMLVPVFTVAENIMLGQETTRPGGVLDIDAARRRVREIADRFGFDLDPDAVVEDLPVGVQQRVEIVKALSHDARLLVFDEPTAVLTPQETDELMAVMGRLRDEGASIVFITHKLREVRTVADRIVVVRDGRVVGEADPHASEAELAELMVGRRVELRVQKADHQPGEISLEVNALRVIDPRGHLVVDDVSFYIRAGEVLAIAGVQGNGQSELVEALLGRISATGGSARLGGRELLGASTHSILIAGVGYVPEDRTVDGLVGEFGIDENLMLDRSFGKPFVRFGSIRGALREQFARERISDFDIRASGPSARADRLSGGNQQKVVVARELSRPLRLLVAAQPTRGVDVGSIEFIHRRIVEVRDAAIPVLVVSTELDEVVALADRVLVMYRGRVAGIVPADTPRTDLGVLMAGGTLEAAAA